MFAIAGSEVRLPEVPAKLTFVAMIFAANAASTATASPIQPRKGSSATSKAIDRMRDKLCMNEP